MQKLINEINLHGWSVSFGDAVASGHVSPGSLSNYLVKVVRDNKETNAINSFEFVCENEEKAITRALDNLLKKIENLTDNKNETKKK